MLQLGNQSRSGKWKSCLRGRRGRKWDRQVSGQTESSQDSSQASVSREGGERRDITREIKKRTFRERGRRPRAEGAEASKVRAWTEEQVLRECE